MPKQISLLKTHSPQPGTSRPLAAVLLVIIFLMTGCISQKPLPESTDQGYVPADLHVKDSAPTGEFDPSKVKPAIPKWEPYSKYGNQPSYKVLGKTYYVLKDPGSFKQQGIASWYGKKFHGRRTSSWEVYDMFAMTAAHKTLPIPSYVKVTNIENNRSAIVKVNDRGPFHEGRIIDLSYAAAHVLGVAQKGTAQVEIELISTSKPSNTLTQKSDANKLASSAPPENHTKSVSRVPENRPPDELPTPLASNNKQTYLQVGAFSTLDRAQNLQSKLMEIIQHPVSISPIEARTNRLLRVLIGPISYQEDIQSLISLIQSHQLGTPLIKFQ